MDDTNFTVKRSTIPRAGKGLFSNVNITKGTVVLQYIGKRQPYHSHKSHDYCFNVGDNVCINALKSKAISRYVNDNFNHSDKHLNLDWVTEDGRVFMVAIRDVTAGDELMISYGRRYWGK